MARNAAGNVEPILPEVSFEVCPIRSSLGTLGRKWALLVLRDIAFLPDTNFSSIMKHNPGMTPRILSTRLRELTRDGLIERIAHLKDERITNYRLTKKGQDAIPILSAFIQFGARHYADRVFQDGKPRNMTQLFPDRQKIMLGSLSSYARHGSR